MTTTTYVGFMTTRQRRHLLPNESIKRPQLSPGWHVYGIWAASFVTGQMPFILPTNRVTIRHYTHTTVLLLFWNKSGTTRVSRYQKGKTRKVKTNLDLLEQEIVSGSGICWAICNAYSLRPPARSPLQATHGSPPIVHTRIVPPCMAQSRLGAFPR